MNSIDVLVPDLPESITDATVAKWHKKTGDRVNHNDKLVDIETDKVMLEVSSPCDGILDKIAEKTGKIVKSQQILSTIICLNTGVKNNSKDSQRDKSFLNYNQPSGMQTQNHSYSLKEKISFFTPSIRRLIRTHSIDISKINLNEIKNKTFPKEFFNHIDPLTDKNKSKHSFENVPDNLKEETILKSKNRVKMTRLRQKISERLLEAKNNMAMLTTFNEVNMEPIILLRKKYRKDFEQKHGIRIGFMSFYVKAVVEALKEFPEINAFIDNEDIVYHNNFDISIAISTPRGLITPVLRNADKMSMHEIEKKIKEFSIKGSENKITIEELRGGNFTITNGGIFGSLMSTPIINPPQAAILGMHLIQDRPMAVNGKIKILPMMYLALSYDHCLIDGKESVSFLKKIKNILEDFTRLLINI
ncbi:dihydrolipoyllysine-residue succinyltransferase [Buchnera aphidicola (Muscaphis stroyani)]|uniref:Dihydrolipoyllysine-residue succinyltransferase n=1 Tax=Buchnera aphidicola (Muscaphis stroyani) TaxID=1241869 RepID=A0A4D6YEX0_9GAMM|nr:dihydrolipoyllysine-residue succinyltransferase [Buchnera aphidicola]QCI24374.1 dihydrolipoyllysine-residue succinyltransferase [Buchnera aphidicola (Muscaphis stroyani)]